MKFRIYLGGRVSEGARELRTALAGLGHDAKILRAEGSTYTPRARDIVINWGARRVVDFRPATMLNQFGAVSTAVDKIATFSAIELSPLPTVSNHSKSPLFYVPLWARSVEEARRKIPPREATGGYIVRTTVTGHSGAGTYHVQSLYELPVPENQIVLVQKYIRKSREYRVHVLGGEVIDVQEKRRSAEARDTGAVDEFIRNHQNGWVYCRAEVQASDRIKAAAVEVVRRCGLDFGAVDIMNTESGAPFMLEVNSAPGLSETTAQKYAEALVTFSV